MSIEEEMNAVPDRSTLHVHHAAILSCCRVQTRRRISDRALSVAAL